MNTNIQNIIDYYEYSEIDYRLFWKLGRRMAMHYGYWDESTPGLAAALDRLNEVLWARAGGRRGERVLDAGCGVGGSSVYLAREFHCRVHGLTLSPRQVRRSQQYARAMGVASTTRFYERSYSATKFPDGVFDIVWAIESVCYARDKKDFLAEAWRVLKPGGRLVVADFFRVPGEFSARDRARMGGLLQGWAVPEFAELNEFQNEAVETGFVAARATDETAHVRPSARRLLYGFVPALFVTYAGECLGLRNRIQTANVWTAYYQYITLRRGLWRYGIFDARKPDRP